MKIHVFLITVCAVLALNLAAGAASTPVTVVNNAGNIIRPAYELAYLAYDADFFLDDESANTAALTVSAFLAQPSTSLAYIEFTPGGTTADIAAGNIVLTGTDYAGEVQTEDVAITENMSTAVTSASPYLTITSIVFPAMDGAGSTWDVGIDGTMGVIIAPESTWNHYDVISLRAHLSAAGGTSENLTLSILHSTSSALNTVLYAVDMNALTDVNKTFDYPLPISGDEALFIHYANTNNRTVGVELVYEVKD